MLTGTISKISKNKLVDTSRFSILHISLCLGKVSDFIYIITTWLHRLHSQLIGCWELNSCPPQKSSLLLIAQPPLQPHILHVFVRDFLKKLFMLFNIFLLVISCLYKPLSILLQYFTFYFSCFTLKLAITLFTYDLHSSLGLRSYIVLRHYHNPGLEYLIIPCCYH